MCEPRPVPVCSPHRAAPRLRWLLCLAGLGLPACAEPLESASAPEAPRSGASYRADVLGPGDRDERVARLKLDLRAYGYLQATPEVPDELFDDSTAEALQRYQAMLGVESTGVLDDDTREAMEVPRCGESDHPGPAGAASLKHSQQEFHWDTRAFSVNVTRYPSDDVVTREEFDRRLAAAMEEINESVRVGIWRTTSSSPTIDIQFVSARGNPCDTANDPFPDGSKLSFAGVVYEERSKRALSATICLDENRDWGVRSNEFDLESVMLHELTHVLGLGHSSHPAAVMNPFFPPGGRRRYLRSDDLHGLWVRYSQWAPEQNSRPAIREIAWGDSGTLYAIARDTARGGYEIWKRTSLGYYSNGGVRGHWEQIPGGAVHIAVEGDRPWVVNGSGKIYRRKDDDSGWQRIPGCARDIGAGETGQVWIIGCESAPGGYGIHTYFWDTWWRQPGGATRVDVRPGGEILGEAVVVNSDGDTFFWRGNITDGFRWVKLAGDMVDVSAGRDGSVWAIDDAEHIHVLSDQKPANGIPSRWEWVQFPGSAESISVSSWGHPTKADPYTGMSDILSFY